MQDNGLGCGYSGRYYQYSMSQKKSHDTLCKGVCVMPTEMPTHYLHIINAYVFV